VADVLSAANVPEASVPFAVVAPDVVSAVVAFESPVPRGTVAADVLSAANVPEAPVPFAVVAPDVVSPVVLFEALDPRGAVEPDAVPADNAPEAPVPFAVVAPDVPAAIAPVPNVAVAPDVFPAAVASVLAELVSFALDAVISVELTCPGPDEVAAAAVKKVVSDNAVEDTVAATAVVTGGGLTAVPGMQEKPSPAKPGLHRHAVASFVLPATQAAIWTALTSHFLHGVHCPLLPKKPALHWQSRSILHSKLCA
jgi:hypothetical protein